MLGSSEEYDGKKKRVAPHINIWLGSLVKVSWTRRYITADQCREFPFAGSFYFALPPSSLTHITQLNEYPVF
jgi:hypothetical protein